MRRSWAFISSKIEVHGLAAIRCLAIVLSRLLITLPKTIFDSNSTEKNISANDRKISMEKNSPSSLGFLQRCHNTFAYLLTSAMPATALPTPTIPSLPPVKLVLLRVAEYQQIDIEGALYLGRADLIPQFSRLGVNFNAIGVNGETLLYMAANMDQVNCALALIREGAEMDANIVKARLENNQTFLHRAAQLGNLDWVKILIGAGLNIDARDTSNRTPIMIANDADHVAVVRILARHGASLPMVNGYTPGFSAHTVSLADQIDGEEPTEENESDYYYNVTLQEPPDQNNGGLKSKF